MLHVEHRPRDACSSRFTEVAGTFRRRSRQPIEGRSPCGRCIEPGTCRRLSQSVTAGTARRGPCEAMFHVEHRPRDARSSRFTEVATTFRRWSRQPIEGRSPCGRCIKPGTCRRLSESVTAGTRAIGSAKRCFTWNISSHLDMRRPLPATASARASPSSIASLHALDEARVAQEAFAHSVCPPVRLHATRHDRGRDDRDPNDRGRATCSRAAARHHPSGRLPIPCSARLSLRAGNQISAAACGRPGSLDGVMLALSTPP